MGPSGSGKTTLLNTLAGQLRAAKGLSLVGNVALNGQTGEFHHIKALQCIAAHASVCGSRGRHGTGAQSVRAPGGYILLAGTCTVPNFTKAVLRKLNQTVQMTVRETLRFAARLRLPRSMSLDAKYATVEEIITKLSLGKCADSIVGGAKVPFVLVLWQLRYYNESQVAGWTQVRGISGGERKRLNIGCELIGSPSLLFLDEPTTGLDSFQAEKASAFCYEWPYPAAAQRLRMRRPLKWTIVGCGFASRSGQRRAHHCLRHPPAVRNGATFLQS